MAYVPQASDYVALVVRYAGLVFGPLLCMASLAVLVGRKVDINVSFQWRGQTPGELRPLIQ